jgi:large subunit ribosomal protein L2
MSNRVEQRKPRSPSLRFQSYLKNDDIDRKAKPEKRLLGGCKKRSGGRNCYGRITTRHIGGGADRKYRIIDFSRKERSVSGVVLSIQYDPNRNVPLALIGYKNGNKQYILHPEGLKVGDFVSAGSNIDATLGCFLPLRNIPIGFSIHNIEIRPGSGGVLVRTAGVSAQLVGKEEDYAILKMPSGEVRMFNLDCFATVGVLSNSGHKNIVIGKAGRSRRMGIRPSVRGMAMNPVDHPHGGGEGRSKSGSHPVSPWGKCSKGTKTRKKKSRFILKRRK